VAAASGSVLAVPPQATITTRIPVTSHKGLNNNRLDQYIAFIVSFSFAIRNNLGTRAIIQCPCDTGMAALA
jgi:hypothetical protein